MEEKTVVIGNDKVRDFLYWEDLTEKEKQEYDYMGSDFIGFRYKGEVYGLDLFCKLVGDTGTLKDKYDGVYNSTFFSGLLVIICDEGIKVYSYFVK